MIPTFFGITLVVFLAVHAAPGDPALLRFGGSDAVASDGLAEARAQFRAEHLLDQPLWKQYLHFVGPLDLTARGSTLVGGDGTDPWHGLLALDFGGELLHPEVLVLPEIGRRLRVTVPLALAAALLSYSVALVLGVLVAVRRDTPFDRLTTAALFLLHSTPTFWLGLLLALVFGASGLGLLPVLGLHDKDADELGAVAYAWDGVLHGVLPVLTLALGGIAYLTRQMRAGMIEVLAEDFVRAARARGLSERAVVWKHAARNAAIPLATLSASIFPALVGGSVIVETIFALPGMGSYAFEGFLARDYNVILATTTLSAACTLVGMLAADLLCAVLDPRLRHV